MIAGVIKESVPGEKRVAIVPAHVAPLMKMGFEVRIESNAGLASGYRNEEYQEKGAVIVSDKNAVLQEADMLLCVQGGASLGSETNPAKELKEGASVIGMLEPYAPHATFNEYNEKKIASFSMELIPRITRAQSMDVLSSMANLAGYKAALIGADTLAKMFPMMMTAAGTIVPAKVFIVGVGVAGLQAIATTKRLGAIVKAYDIRPAVKEQVESLGAKFVEMDLDTGDSETKGGYAKEMDEEFYRKQREMMLEVIAESDVVITTAAIPGKKAPVLVTKEMVEAMAPGSVIVDLAAERGGNCELSQAGKTVDHNGVQIVGPENLVSELSYHASQLYSKNLINFLGLIVKDGALEINTEDEIVDATMVTRGGEITHQPVAGV